MAQSFRKMLGTKERVKEELTNEEFLDQSMEKGHNSKPPLGLQLEVSKERTTNMHTSKTMPLKV